MSIHPWSQDVYLKAFHFAAVAHGTQKYPGTEISYIMHLSFVGMEVIAALRAEPGRNEDLAVQVALLHDTLEDTKVSYERLAAEFGREVADGVQALTKDNHLAKTERMPDSLRRIRQQPPEIAMVKMADRICNLQPPPSDWTPEKIAAYRREAREILAALGEASPFLAARLGAKIERYPTTAI